MFNKANKILVSLAAIFFMLLSHAFIATSNEKIVEVTAYTLNVRAAPSARSPIIGHVNKGDKLTVKPVSKNWAETISVNDTKGFISIKHVKTLERKEVHYNESLLMLISFSSAILIVVAVIATSNKRQRLNKSLESSDATTQKTHTKTQSIGQRNRTASEVDDSHIDAHDFPLAKVVRVIDGDTVIVSSSWRETKIRLDSIDCPEDGQPWGNIATSGLIKLIGGKKVRIQAHGVDHYGRQIATIYVQEKPGADWINVNEKMVVKGHAWVMRKYYKHLPKNRRDKLNHLEKWAKSKRVGLWRTSNPVPPWLWRNNQRVV
jgi:endonuclease YncB( thermonuclease family)